MRRFPPILAVPPEFNISGPNTIYFNMTRGEGIETAKLGLFIRKVETPQGSTLVVVRKFKMDKRSNNIEREFVESTRLILTPNTTGQWYELDVTHAVKEWIQDPHTNYGMQVLASDMTGRLLVVTNPTGTGDEGKVSLTVCLQTLVLRYSLIKDRAKQGKIRHSSLGVVTKHAASSGFSASPNPIAAMSAARAAGKRTTFLVSFVTLLAVIWLDGKALFLGRNLYTELT